MSSAQLSPPNWDLGSVIDLVNSLSTHVIQSSDVSANSTTPPTQAPVASASTEHDSISTATPQLGNFTNIWRFLGAPLDAPAPIVYSATDRGILTTEKLQIADYGSSPPKAVTWQDGLKGARTRNGSVEKTKTPSASLGTLSKKQKKQLRRQLSRATSEARSLGTNSADEDSDEPPVSQLRQSSDRQQIIQQLIHGNLKSPKAAAAPKVSDPRRPTASLESSSKSPASVRYRLRNRDVDEQNGSPLQHPRTANHAHARDEAPDASLYMNAARAHPHPPTTLHPLITPAQQQSQLPLEDPHGRQMPAPAAARPSRAFTTSPEPPAWPSEGSTFATRMYEKTMELFNDPAAALSNYHRALLAEKLMALFPSERNFLTPLRPLITADPKGIHVFVDASNITIGYHDALKLRASLPLSAKIPRQPFSFASLALILERGRPCAKRVLAGSDPLLLGIEAARAHGYEVNLMDRVHKARALTERQRYFAARDVAQRRSGGGSGGGGGPYRSATSGLSGASGTDDAAAVAPEALAPPKWVEQGVDEVLHLKMMESVVDAEAPSTIVLATGDAAEAEYSGGFLAMAERALKRGWCVEVVSFRRNMNGAWRERGWRERWGGRFRVVELEGFLAELGGGGEG